MYLIVSPFNSMKSISSKVVVDCHVAGGSQNPHLDIDVEVRSSEVGPVLPKKPSAKL